MHLPSVRQNLAEDINLNLQLIAHHLSWWKLERINPMSSSRPMISHNHMLTPNVYLSGQLSGNRNTKDSCDSEGRAPEIMWHQNPNHVSVTEEHWEVCHIFITTKVLSILKWFQRIRWTELHNSSCAQEAFSSTMRKIVTFTHWKRAPDLNWKQLSVTWDICILLSPRHWN
jgi:hypothetical protein